MLRRILRRADLRFDAESAAILAWALWGTASPKSLRFCLAAAVRWRDRRVERHFADGAPVRWAPAAAPASQDEAVEVSLASGVPQRA